MDVILIRDLTRRCIVGVRENERSEKQDVLVSLWLYTDLRGAAASDRLEDAVDYSVLKKQILGMAEESRFFLVETLAEAIAGIALRHPAVRRVRVRVEKPTALRFARSVGVQITRRRGDKGPAAGAAAVRSER